MSAPADQVIRSLMRGGWSVRGIARQSSLSHGHLYAVLRSGRGVSPVALEVLRSLPPHPHAVRDTTLVPAEYIAARVRQLRASGWTWAEMGRATGLTDITLSRIATGRTQQVQGWTAAAILGMNKAVLP